MMQGWLARWMDAFNDDDLRVYADFVRTTAPSVTPYLDDDLAVREATGGFDLIEARYDAANAVTAVVRDRAWDRRSQLKLTASDEARLDDIAFMGAPAGGGITRLDEATALGVIHAKIDRERDAGRFSGAALVARGSDILVRQAGGIADEASGAANTPQTRFCIGSMGKMFTAVAVMQLVETGRIRLDDTLADLLPDYPNRTLAERVTIRHLLTHTGGTGDIFGPDYDGRQGSTAEAADLVGLYGARDVTFEPGSRWGYSNYGFVLLGRVLEVVRETPYGAIIGEQVFDPCGMASTSLAFTHIQPTAVAYTGARATGLKALPAYVGLSAGGAYSTVDDLAAFVAALQSGRLIAPDTLKAMTTPVVVAGTSHWGLGVAIRERNGLRYFGHAGSAPGVSGDLAIFPDYATITLCNRGHPAAACLADFMGARLPA